MSTVWVLKTRCDDLNDIAGVYGTITRAMEAWQPKPPKPLSQKLARALREPPTPYTYAWSGPDKSGEYYFDGDCNDAATIRAYEVQA